MGKAGLVKEISRYEVLAFVGYFILTILLTWPLVVRLDNYVPNWGDPLLTSWILAWDTHALLTHPWNLFTTNTFYPWNWDSLAFSEHMISNQLVFFPVYLLTNNPILGSNIILFLSFVISGFGMYKLVEHYTKNRFAAFISGFIFAFTTFRFYHLGHLPLQTYQWMPLTILYFDRFASERKSKDMVLFTLFFLLQLLSSWYLGIYISIMVAFYLLYLLSQKEKRRSIISKRFFGMMAVSIVVIIIVALPFVYPYYELQKLYGFTRMKDEVRSYSAGVRDLFRLPASNNMYDGLIHAFDIESTQPEKLLFPGFAVIILSIIGLLSTIKVRRDILKIDFSDIRIFYASLAIFSLLMCFGMHENFYTPYELFYDFIPGFSSMRVPPRFFVVMIFSLSVLSAFGIKRILNWGRLEDNKISGGVIIVLLSALLFVESLWVPVGLEKVPAGNSVPLVYKWLGAQDGNFAILELPTADIAEYNLWFEARYMYFSTYHWKDVMNGNSGFVPSDYIRFLSDIRSFPSNESIEFLRDAGVRYVLIHKEYYTENELSKLISEINGGYEDKLKFVDDIDGVRVYEVRDYERSFRVHSLTEIRDDLLFHIPEIMREGEVYHGALSFMKDGHIVLDPSSSEIDIAYSGANHEETKENVRLSYRTIGMYSYSQFVFKSPEETGRYNLTIYSEGTVIYSSEIIVKENISDSVSPHELKATIKPGFDFIAANSSELISVPLHITNTGDTLWLSDYRVAKGKYQVNVGWDIFDSDGSELGNGRVPLPFDVVPNDSTNVYLFIRAPSVKGTYKIKVDMVDELVNWFEDNGSKPAEIKLSVR